MESSGAHDYSTCIREAIKDKHLGEEVEGIENERLRAEESRKRILAAIERQYTSAA